MMGLVPIQDRLYLHMIYDIYEGKWMDKIIN